MMAKKYPISLFLFYFVFTSLYPGFRLDEVLNCRVVLHLLGLTWHQRKVHRDSVLTRCGR